MMRRIYTLLMYGLAPWIVLRLLWKSRRSPAYRQRIGERFSVGRRLPTSVDIWLHAVSLGEVVAATPLIERMLAKNMRVLVTTMTPTGSQQVLSRFKSQVSHQYIPYDLPWCLQRFYNRIRPQMGIIMETELWPNLIYYANENQIPLVLVNARLSDRAYEHYYKLRRFFAVFLPIFTWIGAQSLIDAQRYQSLGAVASKLDMVGNMKFDLSFPTVENNVLDQLKSAWGENRPVWLAASTHEDEELQLLSQLQRVKAAIPDLILLIAPRRPERFQMVYNLVQQQGWRTGLRSRLDTIQLDSEVVVLDSMGELLNFYRLSDYAFVGASLVPIGGHNVLEPIAMQVPVFCGPFMQNSKAICSELEAAGAILCCQSAEDIADKLIALYRNPEKRQKQITQASEFLKANRGTVDRYWVKIQEILRQHACRTYAKRRSLR